MNPASDAHRKAIEHARAAKHKMDEALAALNAAEDEWHQAIIELDRLEEVELANAPHPGGGEP